jgi:hypothetical protein
MADDVVRVHGRAEWAGRAATLATGAAPLFQRPKDPQRNRSDSYG